MKIQSRLLRDFIDKMDTHFPRFGEQYRLLLLYEPGEDDGKELQTKEAAN
jgi:hypothetical protein